MTEILMQSSLFASEPQADLPSGGYFLYTGIILKKYPQNKTFTVGFTRKLCSIVYTPAPKDS